ncbi:MAG: hypothetical protein ACE5FN_05235 [Leptospirillia bacterium]
MNYFRVMGLGLMLALSVPALALAADILSPATAEEDADSRLSVPPRAPEFLSARVSVHELSDLGEKTTLFKMKKHGNRLRLIADPDPDPRFVPGTWFDYDQNTYYRKLLDQDIVFSYRVVAADRILAQVYGYMTAPEEERYYRLELKQDVTYDGHPCTLSLIGFPSPRGIHALRWVWEAKDLNGFPVRVVFPQGNGVLATIEYTDLDPTPFDPALVLPPESLPVMSGF